MAYRKRTTRRKTYKSKKSTWRRAAGNALTQVSGAAIKTLKKKLGLNTENKFWDITTTAAPNGTLGTALTPAAGIAQGDTCSTRNGSGLRVTHYSVKGYLTSVPASATDFQVRVIVVYQKNAQQGQVTPAQILQSQTNINSPYNSQLEGIKIVKDKIIMFHPQTTTFPVVHRCNIKWTPGYDEGHVTWTDADTTGASASIIGGFFTVLMMTDIAGNTPVWTFYSRTHFVDN